jgi:CRISPR type III-B/RAMP module RAMP protein Cmr6
MAEPSRASLRRSNRRAPRRGGSRLDLFGSLAVEPPDPAPEEPLWHTPRELLRDLSRRLEEIDPEGDLHRRSETLLREHTGGRLTFYDAVPVPGQQDLLATDLLNPHYPEFYRSAGAVPPSDDQDPGPVYFLAVKEQIAFEFPYRVRTLPAVDRSADVRSWLTKGLEAWGAGGKTAAGYGYFNVAQG